MNNNSDFVYIEFCKISMQPVPIIVLRTRIGTKMNDDDFNKALRENIATHRIRRIENDKLISSDSFM